MNLSDLLRPWRRKSRVTYLLLLGLVGSVAASPSVNVALKASFAAGPYLVELLETAAEENSTSYFPLLDRVAEGFFAELDTEKAVYEAFLKVLQDDGHMTEPAAVASFKYAAAVHVAAPRIEAHYQYYNTSVQPNLMVAQDAACPLWVHHDDQQYCSSTMERAQQAMPMAGLDELLPFERSLGPADAPPMILYADITHPHFGQFHQTLSKAAKEGSSSYRIRYRRSAADEKPLYLNGFGAALNLKRTDYIVIDDRKAATEVDAQKIMSGDDSDLTDLEPLTSAELEKISVKTSSYILASTDPLAALLEVTANFPKYASRIAATDATKEFIIEEKGNRAAFLPQGYTIVWINGVQVDSRSMNAFGLLDHLKRERSMINNVQSIGFSPSQAIDLLSHRDIAQAQVEDEARRYDWRDLAEDGQVIMWLNNIQEDKRFAGWKSNLGVLLQRTFPGQLPQIRRDIHNLVLPVDLASQNDLQIVVEQLQSFVKRSVPVRFGLVPVLSSPSSVTQAKIAYHLLETYGLGSMLSFLEHQAGAKDVTTAEKKSFSDAIKDRKTRKSLASLTCAEVIANDALESRLQRAKKYIARLTISAEGPFFINGVALPRNDNWLETMIQRVQIDMRQIQAAVHEKAVTEASWLPDFFLFEALSRRNALIIPEDPSSVVVRDVSRLDQLHHDILLDVPRILTASDDSKDWVHLLVVADFDTDSGKSLLEEAVKTREEIPGIELVFLHNPITSKPTSSLSFQLYDLLVQRKPIDTDKLLAVAKGSVKTNPTQAMAHRAADYWIATQVVAKAIGLEPGASGLLVNGRFVGPISQSDIFLSEDFFQLVQYERAKRINAVVSAIKDLGHDNQVTDPLTLAKITALVAKAHVSDAPPGIFESPPLIRVDKFKAWNSSHSAIHAGSDNEAILQVVASIDPATETVQRWAPMLKMLSELDGVSVKIFMNPRQYLSEIPIKKFYRYVLDTAPVFDDTGSLRRPQASFSAIPSDALLNLGMDVPAAWTVAPETSSYDLENIKLSSVPADQNIDATYKLEHILIEGHSRETDGGIAPRGVQLLLGTNNEAHFDDTIIMANLGYFQFKANPGFWKISLKPGRSSQIFTIDSIGGKGWAPQPGDTTTSVALFSFHGSTLYPRLSRQAGMDEEDVLESGVRPGSAASYLSRGAAFASSALSSAGIHLSSSPNAAINIFSVASGHLYERMLNIMMASVMKHTTSTVKFWFIEQFLSPSFKASLPSLAQHYNFQYQLVTYKWPHWLRSQSEKQREIWGYKILFLDVLFPLNLDKVIFVDADQIVRTDMLDLVKTDLHHAPYGFTPMCDSRTEMEGFRFWKTGYWANYLQGKPYHISALFVVDLRRFRQLAAGDRLRATYQQLSADPASLSNLDQDLPNHMQHHLPIWSLDPSWLWCETWCADDELTKAKTIDLCNNPLTKEPKLERARRQVPEWKGLDDEVRGVLEGRAEGGIRKDEL